MRICWPQATMILLVVILGISSMLSGCGKKGPLYIPKDAAKQLQGRFLNTPILLNTIPS